MAMTLRLSPTEDETLRQLARQFRTSKNQAAAHAIDLAAPRRDHPEFVESSMRTLLARYDRVLNRLADI